MIHARRMEQMNRLTDWETKKAKYPGVQWMKNSWEKVRNYAMIKAFKNVVAWGKKKNVMFHVKIIFGKLVPNTSSISHCCFCLLNVSIKFLQLHNWELNNLSKKIKLVDVNVNSTHKVYVLVSSNNFLFSRVYHEEALILSVESILG